MLDWRLRLETKQGETRNSDRNSRLRDGINGEYFCEYFDVLRNGWPAIAEVAAESSKSRAPMKPWLDGEE